MESLADAPNYCIAVLATMSLNGSSKRLHTEEIMEKLMELAPSRFGCNLKKYRDKGWPDKSSVLDALQGAKSNQLLEGHQGSSSAKDGWRLTVKGVAYGKEHAYLLSSEDKNWVIPKRAAQRIIAKLKRDELFKLYAKSKSLEGAEARLLYSLVGFTPNASREIVASKFRRLKTSAELLDQTQVSSFLDCCIRSFPQVLDEDIMETS